MDPDGTPTGGPKRTAYPAVQQTGSSQVSYSEATSRSHSWIPSRHRHFKLKNTTKPAKKKKFPKILRESSESQPPTVEDEEFLRRTWRPPIKVSRQRISFPRPSDLPCPESSHAVVFPPDFFLRLRAACPCLALGAKAPAARLLPWKRNLPVSIPSGVAVEAKRSAFFLSFFLARMVGLGAMGLGEPPADYGSIAAVGLFVALMCACIVVGHLLEEHRWMNESTTALLIGLGTGTVILLASSGKHSRILVFSEDLFFIYLLPPIIFNAGFQVKKKQFFRNFMTITLFAVVGTLISFSIISLGALGIISRLNIGALELGDYLALGAIFSATDSVCTLQVLSQDETPFLYSLVFGEGVVNDATSVVLFNAIQNFDLGDLSSLKFLQFIGNFLYLFGASTFLGVATGLLSAYVIKKLYFGRHSTDREVAIMMLMAYLSYMLAELLDLSGILTVFFCGILMSHYTWHNVTESSRVTTKHAFATLSFISETFLFLYVGMDALDIEKWKIVSETYSPMKSIALSSIILALVLIARAAFVFPLSYLSNLTKKTPGEKISIRQQVIIWWAGLMRGAVSIALAYNKFAKSGHTQLPSNAIMITSTITIVLFSTIVFGLLTKPLIRLMIPTRHLTREVSTLSEPSSPKSFLEQVTVDGPEADVENAVGIRRPTSLRMLLASPTRSVHHYWRKFDNAFMRPVFGGRGFVPFVPGSPTESSVPLLAPGSEN